jgi:3-oxoadipate enol-lactonase
MTTTRNGIAIVPEGTVFWKVTAPIQPQRNRNLLFLHSGVTDSTAWDAQVAKFSEEGWTCVVNDRLGFGASNPSAEFLAADPRPVIDFNKHWAAILEAALPKDDQRVVVIGLSMGAFGALEFAIQRPDLVRGLVVTAGGLRDFQSPLPAEEKKLLDDEEKLFKAKDIESLAQWQAHYWGDGPLQPVGRAGPELRAKLLVWCRDISAREVKGEGGEGGMIFETKGPDKPVQEMLEHLKMPTAVAYGRFDETNTNEAMKLVASKVPGAICKDFPTGHIVTIEAREEYNSWLEAFLKGLEDK